MNLLFSYFNDNTGLHLNFVCLFVIKGFLTDYKLLFDTEFKSENRSDQSALVLFYSTFNFFNKYEKYFK